MNVKKSRVLSAGLITVLISGAVIADYILERPILIESIESKTQNGHPVYNQISLKSSPKSDIWIMYQSHDGNTADKSKWDTIRISVDKTKRPYLVKYQQLKDGKDIELKAACLICHANGPRIIRPNFNSKAVDYSWMDKAAVTLMNLKMKSYGRVEVGSDNFRINGRIREVPLKFFGKRDIDHLNVKSCTFCHNSDKFWGRGELERQHSGTIEHLVKNGQMPPWPFQMSDKDKSAVDKFIKGL